jgi:hypothetical protein
VCTRGVLLSGRRDLNSGPHGPEPCALAGLSHAPNAWDYNIANPLWQVPGMIADNSILPLMIL